MNAEQTKRISVNVPIDVYKKAGNVIKIERLSTFQDFLLDKLKEVAATAEVKM